VVDSFVPPDAAADFWLWPNAAQVARYVEWRWPEAWFAIDDDQVGWPDWTRPHVVFSDPSEGISPLEVQRAIRERLAVVTRKTSSLA